MAINFPASPSNGDTYSYSGKTWTYDGTAGKWEPTNILSDVTATATELNYMDGVTSAVQTQLDSKASSNSLGTASALDVGIGANQVVQLNGSGQLPTVDGSQLTGISGVAAEQETFNSSGTWTKPAGVTWVQIECWGGGGSGCQGNFAGQTSGGGGGGAYTRTVVLASTLGSTETVTVGAGGAATTNNTGVAGGETSFGSVTSAKGGKGGINNAVAPSVPYARFNTATASETMFLAFSYAGMPGSGQPYWGGNTIYGGGGGGGSKSGVGREGGTSVFGGAGGAGGANSAGVAGTAPGGGGGGSDTAISGAGADGRVVVSAW